jgi:hypothetical protein
MRRTAVAPSKSVLRWKCIKRASVVCVLQALCADGGAECIADRHRHRHHVASRPCQETAGTLRYHHACSQLKLHSRVAVDVSIVDRRVSVTPPRRCCCLRCRRPTLRPSAHVVAPATTAPSSGSVIDSIRGFAMRAVAASTIQLGFGAMASIAAAQRAALVDLYNATSGDAWLQGTRDGWKDHATGSDPCDDAWVGVTCSGEVGAANREV